MKCIMEDCIKEVQAHGYCPMHYRRWRKYGDPNATPKSDVVRRFWEAVHKTDTCWIWMKSIRSNGYGQIQHNKKNLSAHRFAYELLKGPIPEGMQIDHLCRNRACVNPDHMEPVTPQVNTARGIGPSAINITKTHCPKGHAYANRKDKDHTTRYCPTCNRAYLAKRRRGRRMC